MGRLRMRGGVDTGVEPPPPPEETYGPTMGIDTVKNSTIPRAVTKPASVGAEAYPTDTVAQIWAKMATAAAHPSRTIWFNKGRYNVSAGTQGYNNVPFPLTNGHEGRPNLNGLKIVMESAAGDLSPDCAARTASNTAILDCYGASSPCVFWTSSYELKDGGTSEHEWGAHNITIRGGVIENDGGDNGEFKTWGSKVNLGPSTPTTDSQYYPGTTTPVVQGAFTVEDLVIRNVYQRGGGVSGVNGFPRSVMRRCVFYHCGSSSFGAGDHVDYESLRASRAPWRCVELPNTDPNYLGQPITTQSWLNNMDATTKMFSSCSTFDKIWLHDSWGFGLWNDWRHYNNTVTNCVLEQGPNGISPAGSGMFWEHCQGGNYFRHNYLKNWGNPASTTGSISLGYGHANMNFTNSDAFRAVSSAHKTGNWDPVSKTWGASVPVDIDPTWGTPVIDISWNIFDNFGNGGPDPWPSGEYPHLGQHPWAVCMSEYNREYLPDRCRGFKIHHNKIYMRGSGMGMGGYSVTDSTQPGGVGELLWSEPSNYIDYNDYYVLDLDNENWSWGPGDPDNIYVNKQEAPWTWNQWRGVLAHDANSTRTVI